MRRARRCAARNPAAAAKNGAEPHAASQLMILPVMLFFFPFNFLIKAYSAHAEIRTLLVFQKLNGFTSS
jgi:hypothetical protein